MLHPLQAVLQRGLLALEVLLGGLQLLQLCTVGCAGGPQLLALAVGPLLARQLRLHLIHAPHSLGHLLLHLHNGEELWSSSVLIPLSLSSMPRMAVATPCFGILTHLTGLRQGCEGQIPGRMLQLLEDRFSEAIC